MTLIINGCTSWTRSRMLSGFVHRHEIDILLLQEVSTKEVSRIARYTTHLNAGDAGRGTAILAKEGLELTRVIRLPSGRGLTAVCTSIGFVNIYAPSGTSQRQARETFYNVDLPYLLGFLPPDVILIVFCPRKIAWGKGHLAVP
jgi:exonuclease III